MEGKLSYPWELKNASLHHCLFSGKQIPLLSIFALTGFKSIGSCIVLLIIAIVRGRNIIHARVKAQSFVLACTYFDDIGRLMVTQEGTLPSEKITNHYIETVS